MSEENVVRGAFGHSRTVLGARLAQALESLDDKQTPLMRRNDQFIALASLVTTAQSLENMLDEATDSEFYYMQDAILHTIEELTMNLRQSGDERKIKNFENNCGQN